MTSHATTPAAATRATTAPPFVYYGGKQRLARRIAALMPPHDSYVEPFCGGLSVLLAKHPAKLETVNDLDGHLITLWRVIRDRPEDFERVCALTPHSRAEYLACAEIPPELPDLERARRAWVRYTQGRSGGAGKKGWRYFANPTGTNCAMPRYLTGYVSRIHPTARRLLGVSIECRPALEVIAEYGRSPHALLYVDPPYLGAARNSTGYRHEMTSEAEHRELAKALHACQAAVLLSGYPSDLYGKLYRGWDSVTMTAHTGHRSRRTEVLWSNRPLAQAQLWTDPHDPIESADAPDPGDLTEAYAMTREGAA